MGGAVHGGGFDGVVGAETYGVEVVERVALVSAAAVSAAVVSAAVVSAAALVASSAASSLRSTVASPCHRRRADASDASRA